MSQVAAAISIFAAFLFGLFGIYLSKSSIHSSGSLDWFLTARNSQSWLSIALGFLAAASGSWVFFLPSKMASDPSYGSAGLIILIFYTIAASYPILLIAYVGDIMKKKYPKIRSLADYAGQRFGRPVANYVSCVCIANTGIGLIAEYSALGKLFSFFSTVHIIPIVCIGLSTLMFTTFGGLPVSLGLNRYQMMMGIVLIITVFAYVSSVRDINLFKEKTEGICLTSDGISTIIAMMISYQSLFVFTDCMWQRVLASECRDALKRGAWLGALLTMSMIFFIGLMGYSNFTSGFGVDPNVSFVEIFSDAPEWAITCLMLLGVCMSQGLIASFQHSLTVSVMSLYSSLGFEDSIPSARLASICLHIPLMLIGILKMEITELFLISNILTISSVLPVLLGLVPQLEHYVNGPSVLLGSALSLIAAFIFGYITTNCFYNGLFRVLFDEYSWEPFAIALIASLVGVALCVLLERSMYYCAGKPYISDIKLNRHSCRSHHSYQSSQQYESSNFL